MKKVWKVIWIIVIVLCVAGVACGAAAYFMVETINKVIRVSRQLLQELGHDPSPEEISDEMNMSIWRIFQW